MLLFLKNLLFTILAPGTIGVLFPWLLASDQWDGQWRAPQFSAIPILAVGAAIYFWCLWDFATFGHGTPAPIDAPKRLVVRGLYHHLRNPMYVGVLTVIFGWTVFFGAPGLLVYFFAIATMFHLFVRFYEEPALRRQFGVSYNEYCDKVDRWLPKFRRQ